jgi:putative sterol carrier protein
MADGTLNGTMAFMQGKLKVEGDMSAAMQLQSVTSKIRP